MRKAFIPLCLLLCCITPLLLAQEAPADEGPGPLGKIVWYFTEGGLLMYPLGLLSILALAVIVERTIRLKQDKLFNGELIENTQKLLESNNAVQAQEECAKSEILVGRVLASALKEYIHTEADIETALEETGQRELSVLRNNLSVLSTVARVSPLTGLLGTVFGMIGAFEVLSVAGVGKEELAGQIRVALITTATGLIIAIPVVIAHAYFRARIRKIIARFEDVFIDVIKSVKLGLKEPQPAAAEAPAADDKAESSE